MEVVRLLRVGYRAGYGGFVLLSLAGLVLALWPWQHTRSQSSQGLTLGISWVNTFVPPTLARTLHTQAMREQHGVTIAEPPIGIAPLTPAPLTPIVSRIATSAPVVFITIDDGVFKPIDAAQYLYDLQLPVSAFLTVNAVPPSDYPYFQRLQQSGAVIENHTLTHPFMWRFPHPQQQHELCVASDMWGQAFLRRPVLFRPPYGEYNDDTRRAASECGLKALVLWSTVMQQGALHYQAPHTRLVPGDIVLLHFRPELKADLEALLRIVNEQSMTIGRLEDYLN